MQDECETARSTEHCKLLPGDTPSVGCKTAYTEQQLTSTPASTPALTLPTILCMFQQKTNFASTGGQQYRKCVLRHNPGFPAGTAGLRAKMGPGFNRMNPVTIQQTTQGLLRYLQQQAPQQLADNGVIIGRQAQKQQQHQQQW
jgi:hypothetical protein